MAVRFALLLGTASFAALALGGCVPAIVTGLLAGGGGGGSSGGGGGVPPISGGPTPGGPPPSSTPPAPGPAPAPGPSQPSTPASATIGLSAVSPAIGPASGGTLVTFTGFGFDASTTVTVGLQPVTGLTLIDANTLRGTVPAALDSRPGLRDVGVVRGGAAAQLASAYGYGVTLATSTPGGPTAGGAAIMITGTGFTGATVFRVGGALCTGTVASPTTFNGTTPAGAAGPADVTASDAHGGFTLLKRYMYGPSTLTSISPAVGFTGGGTRVTLIGTRFYAGATVTIGGQALTDLAIGPTTIVGTTAAGTGTGDVVVTTAGGSATLAAAFEHRAFVVDGLSPDLIRGGTIVTVRGGGFGALPADNAVTFNGTAGTVLTASTTTLTVQAPASPTAGGVVVTRGGASTSAFAYGVGPLRFGPLSSTPSVTHDGRFLGFHAGTGQVPGFASGGAFVHDRVTGVTTLASVSSASVAGSPDHAPNVNVSSDGRFVVFSTTATNLTAEPSGPNQDFFLHDRHLQETVCASVTLTGAHANPVFDQGSISADGRYVGFVSGSGALVPGDTNNAVDDFLFDRVSGRVERVSVSSTGEQGNGPSRGPSALSSDGRFVAFESTASNLVAGDSNSVQDVFVRDRQAGTTTRVSVGAGGAQSNLMSLAPAISADGRFVVFESAASNLVSGDTNATNDVFVHDRQAGTTVRASTSSSGAQGNARSMSNFHLSISDDGRYVGFFSEATDLVAGDTNGRGDAFVKDLVTGTLGRVDVTASGVEADQGSRGARISGDGRYVVFETDASNLPGGQGVFITPR